MNIVDKINRLSEEARELGNALRTDALLEDESEEDESKEDKCNMQ